jgi:transcriptional regulator
MYIPRRYEEKDKEKIHAFIRQNSFAILISVYDGLPVGTHIPLQLEINADGKDILMGHISALVHRAECTDLELHGHPCLWNRPNHRR